MTDTKLFWLHPGHKIVPSTVQSLLSKAFHIFSEDPPSSVVREAESTVILPNQAEFRLFPNPRAPHPITWHDAIQIVKAVGNKMQEDGYYERRALLFLHNVHVGYIVLSKARALNFDTRDTTFASGRDADLMLALSNHTITSNVSANLQAGAGISLRFYRRGAALEYSIVVNLFIGAVGMAEDNIKGGKGREHIDWKQLRYQGKGVSLKISIDHRARHWITWNNLVDAEMMMFGQMQGAGFPELEAEIVYEDDHGRAEEILGTMSVVKEEPLEAS